MFLRRLYMERDFREKESMSLPTHGTNEDFFVGMKDEGDIELNNMSN